MAAIWQMTLLKYISWWESVGSFKSNFLTFESVSVSLVDNTVIGSGNDFPDSNFHGAHMGHNWVLSAPGGPHEPCYQGWCWTNDDNDPWCHMASLGHNRLTTNPPGYIFSIKRLSYAYIGIPIIKTRWSHDCFSFIMWIHMPGKSMPLKHPLLYQWPIDYMKILQNLMQICVIYV